MIEPVIDFYIQTLQGMPYFEDVYGLCEMKDNGKGVVMPVFYDGSKWKPVKYNKAGVAYMRQRSAVRIEQGNSMRSHEPMQVFTVDLRVVALTKRKTFPNDDELSAHRLANTIVKAFTFDNPHPLRIQAKAAKLKSAARLYTTDSRVVKNEELQNLETKDFSYDDIAVAVDIELIVTTYNQCIVDPCDYLPRFCLQLENYVALP